MTSSGSSMPRPFNGVHHLKLPSKNVLAAHKFYTTILPFKPLPQYDHFTPDNELFGKMFLHESSKLLIEVRYSPEQAKSQTGWDPITWAVSTRKDLEDWQAWFTANGVKHSRVFTGIKSWLIACEDPDGRIVRLYVQDEQHEWTNHPDSDSFWLGTMEADPNAREITTRKAE